MGTALRHRHPSKGTSMTDSTDFVLGVVSSIMVAALLVLTWATITAIKEALAQTQEPWCMKMNDCKTKCEDCPDEPPQRTWVGLTKKEIFLANEKQDESIIAAPDDELIQFAKAIEAKLKQKNGYAEEKNT